MKFTDEDLEAIKADFGRAHMDLGTCQELMLSLIVRLEAAEAVVNHPWTELDHEDAREAYKAWLKSKG